MKIDDSLTTRPNYLHKGFKNSLLLLFIFFSSACSEVKNNATLKEIMVEVTYNQQVLNCENMLSVEALNWGIQQLAFFISQPRVVQNNGEQPLLLESNDWQNKQLALLRWSPCYEQSLDNNQNSALPTDNHATLQLSQAQDISSASRLKFTLGIPFESNHLNPLSQKPPLNIPTMFWSWRGGHKFFRLDMQSDEQSWIFHLGSTGCTATSAMRSPQNECSEPNRIEFDLTKQQNGDVLVLHLDRLIAGIELNNKQACLMQPERASCQMLLTNLANNHVFEWR
jgi:uncharacterized repeat protein (TIGR04052 family)